MFSSPTLDQEVVIAPCQLRPGLFVRLPHNWLDHPFLFNQFRIANDKQVETLLALGLKQITYVPGRSTVSPLPLPKTPPPPPPAPAAPTPEQIRETQAKRRRAEIVATQRVKLAKCEKEYLGTAGRIRDIMNNLFAESERSVLGARQLVGGVVETFTAEADVIIHLMGDRVADENAWFHSLNVMILALLQGKAIGLDADEMRVLGEGALFHDMGKIRVPDTVLRNPARNRHEEEFYRLHTLYGGEMARKLGLLSAPAIAIIEGHHETLDGRGFPKGLAGNKISRLARLVGIANRYDNLCNPLQPDKALTPAEAMALMFRNEQAKWGQESLQIFVRMLGVYPPGSLVQLSNGNVGVVVSVDHADLLRPCVLVYDPHVPKSEALIADLGLDEDVKVERVIPPKELSEEVRRYLAPRKRLSYFHSSK